MVVRLWVVLGGISPGLKLKGKVGLWRNQEVHWSWKVRAEVLELVLRRRLSWQEDWLFYVSVLAEHGPLRDIVTILIEL